MHADLRQLPPNAEIAADLCIVGAGIAGINIARHFLGSGFRLVLLESGGLDYEPVIQELAAGENRGFGYYPLQDARLRLFGGTTAIWGGRAAMLDDIDFRARSWVPHSGWPLSPQDLQPWYARARSLLELDTLKLDPLALDERLWPRLGAGVPAFDPDIIRTAFWQFDRRLDRHAAAHCTDLWRADNIQVITHASVTRIQAFPGGRGIRHVVIAEPGGKKAVVRARQFVLAAGGIENARLLLASNDVQRQGLGNDRDLVGRFFMEHPHARGGRIHVEPGHLWRLLHWFSGFHHLDGQMLAACLRPGEKLQAREGILNTSFALACRQHPEQRLALGARAYQAAKHGLQPTRLNRSVWRTLKRSVLWLSRYTDPLRPWLMTRLDLRGIYAVVRAEQAPNPASRVCLGRERDALGMLRVVLDWQPGELDRRSVRVTLDAFDRELRRLQVGRVELMPWLREGDQIWQSDPLVSGHPIGGFHHMGTTRMAGDPGRGVVDADCRVFGIDNLYIAGSSVFPTSGWANPTLTLLALSLRLGAHVRQVLHHESEPVVLASRVA